MDVLLNCWEFKKCGREITGDCAAVKKNAGRICWLVAGTMCGGEPQGSFAKKIRNCRLCDFYLHVHNNKPASSPPA